MDTVISRVVDVLLAFPLFLLALGITGLIGPGLRNLTLALVAVAWAGYARIVRSRGAGRAGQGLRGGGPGRRGQRAAALRKHVLPNVVAPVLVLTTLDMGVVLLAVSGLSFLGPRA